ncbi:pentatricopeptide repeat-containing protein At3g13880 isoform X3 [Durio zibethinus]|uniref:Pentatricopeptide repeat-containing protein At3g13880 isoform X3 n=1 Tax=Durio zibethinus TaxID=66656 RepID=A0A6P5WQY8_DURZI|nr:pentatricopeptide repeat-containing protein At3g13880 isoform X3 [Durio zibethinus]
MLLEKTKLPGLPKFFIFSPFYERFYSHQSFDSVTYTKLVQNSTKSGCMLHGKLAHTQIIKSAFKPCLFLLNNLLNMYSKAGEMDVAHRLFDKMSKPNLVSYNSLISGYNQMGAFDKAMQVFVEARKACLKLDKFTYAGAIHVCAQNGDLKLGKLIHGLIVVRGLVEKAYLTNSLIDMYFKCERADQARFLFENSKELDAVSWNTLIAGYVRMNKKEEMLKLLISMHRNGLNLNTYTMGSVLKACCTNTDIGIMYGEMLHGCLMKLGLDVDIFVGTALLDMYAKKGELNNAIKIFKIMPNRNIVMYNAMISGFTDAENISKECANEACGLFFEIQTQDLATARLGELVHGHAIKSGLGNFRIVQNSQICMYAKCGDMDSADLTFQETENPDVVSWSVMICSYAQHGCARGALNLFGLMKEFGILPNHITFTGVLSACSYGGLVEEGLQYFESMKDYDVEASVEHYCCVVDLFGRAGRLAEAENFILTSSFKDNPVIWRALLSSCRVYKDTVTGKRAARKVIELEPQEAASYVLLRNIYADAALEPLAASVRELMQQRGVKKKPGLSWI